MSCRVARAYVSVSDRRVSHEPHDWPNSYVCVTVERSDMSREVAKKNLLSQSVEYCMHCINYAKREQGKPLLLKLTLRLRSTLSQTQSAAYHELLVVFGLSTLNSNRTNHKTRKKLANQKRPHMSLRLCGVRTQYCALIRRLKSYAS